MSESGSVAEKSSSGVVETPVAVSAGEDRVGALGAEFDTVVKLLSVPVLVPAEFVAKALKKIVVPIGSPVRLVL